MIKFKQYDIEQPLKLKIDFNEFIPKDHLSRKVEEIVSELDVTEIIETYKKNGQKPYHPRMILSIIFYGYMTGIRSGRKLETACRRDLVFIYLSKCYGLGKSTLNDFRKLHYIHFESLFLQVLQKCQQAGLVSSAISIVDGSKISANSSKKRSKTKAQFEKWQQCLEEDIAELKKEAALSVSVELAQQIERKIQLKKK
jgi:transposase